MAAHANAHALSPGITEVVLRGDIDLYNHGTVKELIVRLWSKGVHALIVDLTGVTRVDSSGIGALLYIYTGCRTRDIDVCFYGAGTEAARILVQTKLDGYLPLADSQSQALMAVGADRITEMPEEPIRQLRVDANSPLFDTTGMYFKEFNIDLSQVRRLSGLIVQKAPPTIREVNILEQQISEIVKNGVRHGNGNDKTKALRVWFAFSTQSARLVVADEGDGFAEIERWNEFYRRKIECYRGNRFEEMMEYLSFRTGESREEDGGNALCAAIEYWNDGVVFNDERNAIAVQRTFRV